MPNDIFKSSSRLQKGNVKCQGVREKREIK